jgi:hypothetical protein
LDISSFFKLEIFIFKTPYLSPTCNVKIIEAEEFSLPFYVYFPFIYVVFACVIHYITL